MNGVANPRHFDAPLKLSVVVIQATLIRDKPLPLQTLLDACLAKLAVNLASWLTEHVCMCVCVYLYTFICRYKYKYKYKYEYKFKYKYKYKYKYQYKYKYE